MNSLRATARPTSFDVLVVGGGPAGLSGALALSRARRRVLVVDEGHPRNSPAHQVHNYLGREGTPPGELLARGREEAEAYGAGFASGRVTGVVAHGEGEVGFRVTLGDGSQVQTRRLLVTSGLTDELPNISGLDQRWGRDVLSCPYCHGWEVQDRAIGVLATGPLAVHQALLFRQWSPDITLFSHAVQPPSIDQAEQLEARGISVVPGVVTGLEVSDDALTGVRLATGEVVGCQALVVAPVARAHGGVLATVGLEPEDQLRGGHLIGRAIPSDGTGATSVPGIWVAGNVTDLTAQVISSAAAGLVAAAAVNADLIAEETQDAVSVLRAQRSEPLPELVRSAP